MSIRSEQAQPRRGPEWGMWFAGGAAVAIWAALTLLDNVFITGFLAFLLACFGACLVLGGRTASEGLKQQMIALGLVLMLIGVGGLWFAKHQWDTQLQPPRTLHVAASWAQGSTLYIRFAELTPGIYTISDRSNWPPKDGSTVCATIRQ